MQTITDHIRANLLSNLGVFDRRSPLPDLDVLRESQRSLVFETLCRNRMVLGAFRYGLIDRQRITKSPYDNIGSAIRRLQQYQRTGNLEHLCDVANLCMIEFEIGNHPQGHWRPTDDGEHVRMKT